MSDIKPRPRRRAPRKAKNKPEDILKACQALVGGITALYKIVSPHIKKRKSKKQ